MPVGERWSVEPGRRMLAPMRATSWLVIATVQASLLLGCPESATPPPPAQVTVSTTPSASASASAAQDSSSAPLDLIVNVHQDTWTVRAQGAEGTGPCAAITEVTALTACARSLKNRFPDEATVVVSGDPEVSYQHIVATLDALRVDGTTELFPEFNLGIPKGAFAPSSPRSEPPKTEPPKQTPAQPTAPPAASVPFSIPKAVYEATEDGVVIRIFRSQITVGDETTPVLTYAPESLGSGLPATAKANGQLDLFIVPLGRVLARHRQLDKKIRAAKGEDSSSSTAIIIADATTPYRVLFEVLFTAGQSELGRYHLLVRQGGQ
jgi:biopolymer transport protein ExbD